MAGDEAAHALHERLLAAGREQDHPHAVGRLLAQQPRELEQRRRPRRGCRWRRARPARRDVADGEHRAERQQAAQAAQAAQAEQRAEPGERGPGDDELHQRRRGLLAVVPVGERVGDPAVRARGGRSARRARRRGGRRRRRSRRRPGRPPRATTLDVVRRGSSAAEQVRAGRDVVGDPGRRGQPGGRGERPRARDRPAAAPTAPAARPGRRTSRWPAPPRAGPRARARRSASRIHSAARRSPAEADGRSIASRCSTVVAQAAGIGRHGAAQASTVRAMNDPDCLFCKIVAGEIPATVRARGRAHDRVHGHQPGDARARAGDPARARARTCSRSAPRTSRPAPPPRRSCAAR